jgi:hypothetical protein
MMWSALNPGGALILSVACTGSARRTGTDFDGHRDRSFQSPATLPYDREHLKSRLFDVLGEPRSYAIYGEEGPNKHSGIPDCMSASPRDASWLESAIVSKYWRRCASISKLRGNGLLVLKFIKPHSLPTEKHIRNDRVFAF